MEVKDFGTKDIKTSYCIDLDTRDRQVVENINRIKNRIEPHSDREDEIAIVCYGPSLQDTWEQVKDFKHIMTCSGSHKFLLDKGLDPSVIKWYHNEVDPRPHKAELIGQPHKHVEYLCASVCHKDVFDLLEGYNVKLWHVFAHESGRDKVPFSYPRGEWSLVGGSNVGLRSMVLARFLGFKKMTIFGMDYSFKNDGTQHAGWHPKEIPNVYAVKVGEEFFYTNPPMHQYAQQFFHEVQQLGDIDIKVVGQGLLQAQIREYIKDKPLVPKGKKSMIAAASPKTISNEYIEMNKELHKRESSYGTSGSKRTEIVKKLIASIKPTSVLDYGCGKGTLAISLGFPIWEYDPAIPGKDSTPRPADLVICTDVLEHIEPDYLDNVLLDLSRCTLQVCYCIISTRPAAKTLSDGRNAHLIQKSMGWWKEKLGQFFNVATIQEENSEISVVLGPIIKEEKKKPDTLRGLEKKEVSTKSAPSLDFSKRITPVRYKGTEVQFYTPNDQTQWRAKSLFTKEPITIEWIDTFKPGETLWDIGANMGGYSVWAAKRRDVKVCAFEPEATNYALLCKNFTLNNVNGLAYPFAISNESKLSVLFLSSQEPGGSCNSFDEPLTPDLMPRKPGSIKQGCMSYTLDDLMGILKHPDHIKIDVDGLEHLVIKGATNILNQVKSILLEVNQNLSEHLEMIKTLQGYGFSYSPDQVEKSVRKEGAFKGCAEYLFTRKVDSDIKVINNTLSNLFKPVVVNKKPFPWIYIENVFNEDEYKNIQQYMPKETEYQEILKSRGVNGYPLRYTCIPKSSFWTNLFDQFRDGVLRRRFCEIFSIEDENFKDECLLVRDKAGYKIGPHTDSPIKVITALFYLPKDESLINAGTSIYIPKDKDFKDDSGRHYEFDVFDKIWTAPFKPNSVFAFLKTDDSFHGVEPCDGTRDVLLYDIRRKM